MTGYPIGAIATGAGVAYGAATLIAAAIAFAGFPLPPTERRIGCIDGLRGYLALSVLIHHFVIWMQVSRLGGGWTPPSVYIFNQLGLSGVTLFFMTTGLVFYPRVLAGFRGCSWPATYITRLFRIEPLIVVSFAIIIAIIAIRTGQKWDRTLPRAATEWIVTWGEPPLLGYPESGRLNAYVLWSLWYEWLFYLFVLPACAIVMDLIRGRFPSWALPIGLLLAGLVARRLDSSISMLRYLPLFAIGMLAYELQLREDIRRRLQTSSAALAAVAALALGMIAFPTPYTFALPLFGLFFTCVACGNSLGGILRTSGALVLGECSYGIYVFHGIILSIIFVDAAAFTGSIAVGQLPFLLPLAASVVTLLTAVTYLAVERPMILVGSRTARYWNSKFYQIQKRLPATVAQMGHDSPSGFQRSPPTLP